MAKADTELTGLDGWLSLVFLGMVIGVLEGMVGATRGTSMQRWWHAGFGSLCAALLVLMALRSRFAPAYAKLLFWFLGLLNLAAAAIVVGTGDLLRAASPVGGAASAFVWLAYFRRSRRVKLTFAPRSLKAGGGETSGPG